MENLWNNTIFEPSRYPKGTIMELLTGGNQQLSNWMQGLINRRQFILGTVSLELYLKNNGFYCLLFGYLIPSLWIYGIGEDVRPCEGRLSRRTDLQFSETSCHPQFTFCLLLIVWDVSLHLFFPESLCSAIMDAKPLYW